MRLTKEAQELVDDYQVDPALWVHLDEVDDEALVWGELYDRWCDEVEWNG